MRFIKTLAIFVLIVLSSNSVIAGDRPLRVAVASNFAPVLERLTPDFTAQTGIQVQLIKGASGTLYQQIKHGAPYDIFMSADAVRPQQLLNDNLVIANSLHTYAYGQLAYCSANREITSLSDLAYQDSRLAIANPDIAPYGKAAKQVLRQMGLWQQYQSRLIVGINIGQTFQQVRSKAVSSGIVANSQLVLNELNGLIIPENYYSPIQQQVVILKSSQQHKLAQSFLAYLLAEPVQARILAFGYAKVPSVSKEP